MLSRAWEVRLLIRGGATRASTLLGRRGPDIAVFDTGMAHNAPTLRAALAAEGVDPAGDPGLQYSRARRPFAQ